MGGACCVLYVGYEVILTCFASADCCGAENVFSLLAACSVLRVEGTRELRCVLLLLSLPPLPPLAGTRGGALPPLGSSASRKSSTFCLLCCC